MNDHDRDEHNDYLWDGTGVPDQDIVRLENTLRPLRHRGSLPPLPASRSPEGEGGPPRRAEIRTRRIPAGWLAAAAAVVLLAAGAWFAMALRSAAWHVSSLSGAPAVEGRVVSAQARMSRGDWLVTDSASRARISVGGIGSVDVDPNTRLQLVASGREHHMTLDRGTIHARIWAPPKLFFVNTQAARAIDLGCAYTLQVDEGGNGLLRVTHGWVGLERDNRATYIPQGAVCPTRVDRGPGTPRYEDAPSGYAQALMVLDFADAADPRRSAALDLVLSTARRRDALTLWHLLTRGSLDERGRVFDRLSALAPPPDGVTRDLVLRGDRAALDRWWDWLGIEVSSWWRLFKKKW
jgi:ferric-dicitrate binding protein FerR (iron transport regulator)